MNSQWTIFLCTHDAQVRARWRSALDADSEIVEIDSNENLRQRCRGDGSELILLHVELPGLGGESGVTEFAGTHADSRVLVLADRPEHRLGIAVLKYGARGFANTYIDPRLLAKAVAAVQGGEIWVGRKLMTSLIEAASRNSAPSGPTADIPALDQLTEREREIAVMIGNGANNKRIASDLGIAERTVKAHLGSIFEKTPARDRLQLALIVNGLPI